MFYFSQKLASWRVLDCFSSGSKDFWPRGVGGASQNCAPVQKTYRNIVLFSFLALDIHFILEDVTLNESAEEFSHKTNYFLNSFCKTEQKHIGFTTFLALLACCWQSKTTKTFCFIKWLSPKQLASWRALEEFTSGSKDIWPRGSVARAKTSTSRAKHFTNTYVFFGAGILFHIGERKVK